MAVSQPDSYTLYVLYESSLGTAPAQKSTYILSVNVTDFSLTEEYFPAMSAEGATFLGWAYNGTIVSTEYLFTDVEWDSSYTGYITLTAVWQEQYAIVPNSRLTAIAESIREKTGSSDQMGVADMPVQIRSLLSSAPFEKVVIGVYTPTETTHDFAVPDHGNLAMGVFMSYEACYNNTNLANMHQEIVTAVYRGRINRPHDDYSLNSTKEWVWDQYVGEVLTDENGYGVDGSYNGETGAMTNGVITFDGKFRADVSYWYVLIYDTFGLEE